MVKKQTGGKAKASAKKLDIKKFWHAHWVGILIGVLVFGIFAFIGVNKLIIYNQKKQFDAAEASLDALYADIVKEVGQPTSTSKDKSCTYRSVEIGQGERSCGISYTASFSSIDSKDASREFAKKIEKTISNNPKMSIANSGTTYEDPYAGKDAYKSSDNIKNQDTKMWCYASYGFNPSNTRFSNSFVLIVGCSDKAKSEFYPVKN